MNKGTPAKAPRPDDRIRLFLADVDGALVTRDKVLTVGAQAAVPCRRLFPLLWA